MLIMKIIEKKISQIITTLLCLLLTINSYSQKIEPAVFRLTDTTIFNKDIAEILKKYEIPGAAIAIIQKDNIWINTYGYADIAKKIPVNNKTIFSLGSISKTYLAIAIMQLVKDTKISLDDPVKKYIPDIEIKNKWESEFPVRIIHLLEHTSGIDDVHFNEGYLTNEDNIPTLNEIFSVNPKSRNVRWKSGEFTSYSNDAYSLLALVIEKATGMKFEEYIRQNILDKTGANSTTYYRTAFDKTSFAQGYTNDGKPVPYTPVMMRPSGGINSDISDLAKFVQMILNNGQFDQGSIIDSATLVQMRYPSSSIPAKEGFKQGYGSGFSSFFVDGQKFYGHGGGLPNFNSIFLINPESGIGFIVLINQNSDYFWKLVSAVASYLDSDKSIQKDSSIYSIKRLNNNELTGYYTQANYGISLDRFPNYFLGGQTITFEEDSLYITEFQGNKIALIHVDGNAYRMSTENFESVYFFEDSDGKMMLTISGKLFYYKGSAWIPAFHRIFLFLSIIIFLSFIVFSIVWPVKKLVRKLLGKSKQEFSVWGRLWPLLGVLSFFICLYALSVWFGDAIHAGKVSLTSILVFAFSLLFPLFSLISIWSYDLSKRTGFKNKMEKIYLLTVSFTLLGLSIFFYYYEIVGLRLWAY